MPSPGSSPHPAATQPNAYALTAAQVRALARRRWRWLAWPALAAVAMAALLLAMTPRWYASHALLRIAGGRDASAAPGSDAAAAATLAAAQLAASPQVVAPVAEQLHLAQLPEFTPHRHWQATARAASGAFEASVRWWRTAAWPGTVAAVERARRWLGFAASAAAVQRPVPPSRLAVRSVAHPAPRMARATPPRAAAQAAANPLRRAPAPDLPGVPARRNAVVISAVLSRLRVQPHPHSDLLDLDYRDHDPRRAAAILGAICQELQRQIEGRAATGLARREAFLAAQSAAASRQWQAAEQALVAFRAAHPADAAGPRQSAAMARLMALSQALTQAEIDLWRQRSVVAAGRGAPGQAAAGAGRLANLRLQEARLAAQESRLAAQYGPTALPLVQARRALASVQASLRRYRRAILSGHQAAARADGWELARLQQAVRREGHLLSAAEANAAQDRVLAARARARQDLYQQLWQRRRQLAMDRGWVRQAVQILAPARIAARPMPSPWVLALAAAGLLGLLAGLGIALGFESLAPRLRSENAPALGLPVLGRLPLASSAGWQRDLDELWITLLMAAGSDTTFLFTSTGPDEGKTTVARALGERLSQAGHSVLLLDCHFGAPRLTVEWAAQPTPGLAEYLDGRCPLEALLRNAMAAPGPAILPAGQWRPDSAGALASPAFARLLAQLARSFDWVFLDGGSLAAEPEVRLLARAADAALFIAADGSTPLAAARQAVQRLRLGAAKKMALILNAAPGAVAQPFRAPASTAKPEMHGETRAMEA